MPRPAAHSCSASSGTEPIRVAVVDDSTVARTMIGWALEQAGMQVVSTASNGRDAVAMLSGLSGKAIDVIILDLEMPGVDGLSALPRILRKTDAAVLVVSSLTTAGAQTTIEALRLGAADTLAKPGMLPGSGGSLAFGEALVEKVRALGKDRSMRQLPLDLDQDFASPDSSFRFEGPVEVLAIAASTGGPSAMFALFADLAPMPDVPILVTQHLPSAFIPILAEHLSRHARRPAMVVENGQQLVPGAIHLAPGDAHLGIAEAAGRKIIALDRRPAPSGCKPSADPMFAAAARHFGPGALAVVLSGMGRDGAEGARAIRENGGGVIAQDIRSSVVWGMPGTVVKQGIAQISRSPAGIMAIINSLGAWA